MLQHDRTRISRAATLHKLAFTTALAGSLALMSSGANAQAMPGTPTPGQVSGGSAPTFTNGTTPAGNATLDVNLRATSTVINWTSFNIGSGNEVAFKNSLPSDVAVLNRVNSNGGISNIRGALTSDATVSVFLVNPNGIMIHGSGSVSTGSFVASTLNITDSDFVAQRYDFSPNYGSDRAGKGVIDVSGSITTRGAGIGLILLGREIKSSGALDSGTQSTALVAADNVTLNYSAGSPLGIQITQGTDVSDAMQIVGGSIQGRDVYFAMATRVSATNSLLQIDANVRAVGGDKGIVIVAGRSSVDPDVVVSTGLGAETGSRVGVETGGTLSYGGNSEGGVRIGGTGEVTVAGAVTSSGDYTVRGRSVTLGAQNTTVLQQANRAVKITATDGDVTGLGTLTLASDIDGTVGDDTDGDGTIDRSHAMTIQGDDITFGGATRLESGGAGLVSAINFFSDTINGSSISLGSVFASTLDGGVSGGSLQGGLLRGNGSSITAGTVVLSGSANVQAATLTLGSLSTAGSITLNASALRAGSVTSNGAGVTIDASTLGGRTTGTRANVAAAGAIDIDVSGAALLGTINAGAATTIEAGSIDASSVTSGGLATLTSQNGDLTLGGLTVFGGGALIDADDSLTINGPVGIIGDYRASGDDITLGGTQQATGAVTMTAGDIGSTGTLRLTANSDGVGTEELKLSGRVGLGANSTLNGGSARQSNVVIDTPITNAVTLGDVNAAALSIANGTTLARDLTLGDVVTTADLTLASTTAIRSGGLRSTAGLVDVRATTMDVGAVRAATSATLSGRQVDFASVDAASARLSTSGSGGTRRLSGTSVTTSGTTTLTSDGGAISIGAIAAGGLSVTSAGNVSLDSVGVAGDATITTTGSADIALADGLTATGAVSLTGADDITASSIASTGGALTITAGGAVTGMSSDRAGLRAAGNLVVNAADEVRLSTVSGNSVTLRAGTVDATTITGAAGIDLSSLNGDLAITGLSTTGGNVTLNAFGAASVNGPVSVVGDYTVSGNGVTLGGTQGATGAVDVTARGGSIGSGAGLQLTANSDGSGTEALTLHGRANLGVDSLLRGGSDRQSQVVIDAGANTNIRLGDVDASSLAIAGGAALSGSLTFGNVVTSDSVSLTVNGGIIAGGLTSLNGSVTLGGNGGAMLGTVSGASVDVAMRGDVDVASFTASSGAARFASSNGAVALASGSTTGDLIVEASGPVSITGAITSGRDYRVRGGAVALGVDADTELQSAAGLIDIVATDGAIVGGEGLTLRSGTGALILDGAGGIDLGAGTLQAGSDGTGLLGLRAGNGQVIDLGETASVGTIGSVNADHSTISGTLNHSGDVRFGTLQAANSVNIQLADFALYGLALNSLGTVTIETGSGGIDIGGIDAVGLSMAGGAITGGSYRADGNIALDAQTITLTELGSATGSVSAITRGGTLSIDDAHAAVDMTLTSAGAGDVSVGTASAGRNLSLISRNGNVRNNSATAGGVLTLDAAGDILGRDGEDPDLSGDDVVLVVVGNLITNSITAPGSLTVTASSIRVNNASAGNNLSLTAARGALSVGTATAGGSVNLTAVSGINVGTLTSGADVAINSGGPLSLVRMTAPGVATIRAAGDATLGSAEVAGLDIEANSIDAGELSVGGGATLTSTVGDIDVELLTGKGAITIDSAEDVNLEEWNTPGSLTASGVGTVALGTGTSSSLTATGGAIEITDADIAGATSLTTDGAISIGMLASGSAAITAGNLTLGQLTADEATLSAQDAQINSLILGTLTLGGGSANIVDAVVTGSATADLTGALTVGRLEAGTAELTASATQLGTVTADSLRVSGGSADIGEAVVTGTSWFELSGLLDIDQLNAAAFTGTAGSITAGTLSVTGATELTSTAGAIDIGALTSGNVTITANNILAIDQLRTGTAALRAQSAQLGTLTLTTLNLTGGSAQIADATLTGAASIDLTGALNIERLTAPDLTALVGGLATLGTVTGTNTATVRAGDIDLTGTLRGATVTVGSRDAAAGLRLGSAGDGQGAGAGLSEIEIGRIDANRAVFDGGTGTVAIGALAFGTGTGRTRVDVLTTGAIEVSGAVTGSGAGRSFRFGGTGATEGDLASAIRVIATADGGGRLLFEGADLELRGARIGVGNNGLIEGLFAGGGLSAEAAAALIGNSNSPLYNALLAGEPYLPGAETTLSASRLTLRFDDFALFQNTGTRGFNTGVTLSGSTAGGPTLSLIGPGNGVPTAFAMFGTINGVSGTSTAVLGNTVISTNGVDFTSARINGCVLGTGAGCLTTTISQPTLNVFDPGRLVVFQVETDFTIPFDPVIGSNNEALFAGAGALAEPAPETVAPSVAEPEVSATTDCAPGETGCTPAQQDQ